MASSSPIFTHFHQLPDGPSTSSDQFKLASPGLICKHCSRLVPGSYKASSDFHTHMKRWHEDIMIETPPAAEPTSTMPGTSAQSSWKDTDAKQVELTDHLMKFICNSSHPPSIVDEPDFRALLNKAQPSYNMPSQEYLTTTIVPTKKEQLHTKIFHRLEKIPATSLLVEVFERTSRPTQENLDKRTYIAITAHFIDNFQLQHAMLSCKQIKGSQDVANISRQCMEVVDMFNLKGKITAIIFAGTCIICSVTMHCAFSSNIGKMAESHMIHILEAVGIKKPGKDKLSEGEEEHKEKDDDKDDDDENNDDVTSLLVLISQHAKSLYVADIAFEAGEVSGLHVPLTSIPSFLETLLRVSAHTTGNTCSKLHQRFIFSTFGSHINNGINQQPYDANLNVDELTTYDRDVIQEIRILCAPVFEAMEKCKGDKAVTASLVIPCIRGLRSEYNKLSTTHPSQTMTDLKSSLEKHFSYFETIEVFQVAAALDPRFKLDWCSPDEAEKMRRLLHDKVAALSSLNGSSKTLEESPKKKFKLFQFMSSSTGQSQVDRYLVEPSLDEDADPLQYWSQKRYAYPELAQLAVNVLATPVSASLDVPERDYYSDVHFEEFMFLRSNFHLE
ncbi:zinc finger BED domain-containing protein 4-like [Amphiura filiformis]|uniref:zinc finger BED domain-containing protein 4-like n=1 Tax=Amphiura filiformis TaxID=82378 RepID=UPI003B2101A4